MYDAVSLHVTVCVCTVCECQSGVHVSDMDFSKLSGAMDPGGKHVISTRIRVGRNIRGFGLSPGITREDRATVERLVGIELDVWIEALVWMMCECVFGVVVVGRCAMRCLH